MCRRRQILDHFGDEEECRPTGRCCDVCDPDVALEQAVRAPLVSVRRARGARGARGVRVAADPQPARPQGLDARAMDPVDEREFERLRAWRWERAEGKPAYTVAANAVLEEVLRRRPASVDDLTAIRGIGPAFCAKHGASLLEALSRLDAAGASAADTCARRPAA